MKDINLLNFKRISRQSMLSLKKHSCRGVEPLSLCEFTSAPYLMSNSMHLVPPVPQAIARGESRVVSLVFGFAPFSKSS
jgi:hypothetical protein